jgi:hypothetical protein
MGTRRLAIPEPSRSRISGAGSGSAVSVLRLGAVVSVIQSALFVVTGVAGLVPGDGRHAGNGFASLPSADPAAFRVLCVAFVLIAVLGLAITAAERALIEPANAGLARFGAVLAYLGHAGTIAFLWIPHLFLRSLREHRHAC